MVVWAVWGTDKLPSQNRCCEQICTNEAFQKRHNTEGRFDISTSSHLSSGKLVSLQWTMPSIKSRNVKYDKVDEETSLWIPQANFATFHWHFISSVPPEIRMPNARIGQVRGRETILECTITAFPHAVNYWEKDGKRINTFGKHRVEAYDEGDHTLTLSLRIHSIQVGISKERLNKTRKKKF